MTVSSLGDWVGFVAVAALVSSLERSPSAKAFAVAGMMMARLLPLVGLLFAILAAISGWVGDHCSAFSGNHFCLPLWLDAGTFAFSAFMVTKLNLRGARPTPTGKFEMSQVGRDIKEGFRFLR